jgi:hypothetical protein
MPIDVKYETKDLKKLGLLLDIAKNMGMDPPLKRMGVYMFAETEKTFRAGKRGDVTWAPLSTTTFDIRDRLEALGGRARGTDKPLFGASWRGAFNTQLMGSKAERDMRIFTANEVAGYHHHGVPRGRFKVFGRVAGFLPERPILFFVAKDRKKMVTIFKDYVGDMVHKTMRKVGLRKR